MYTCIPRFDIQGGFIRLLREGNSFMARKTDRITGEQSEIIDFDSYPLPKARKRKALEAKKCRWRIDHKKLGFKTTEKVRPLKSIVGQPRASAALKLGAQIRGKGYNIFVTGLSATGRSTAVKTILEGLQLKEVRRWDHCYVNNFKSPEQPRLIVLPGGKGREFKHETARLVETLKQTIPHALEDETVLARKREVTETYAKKEAELFKELEEKVGDDFALVQVQMGPYTRPDVFPIIDGEPVPPNQVGKMVEEGKFPKEEVDALYKRYQGYKADLRAVLKRARALNRKLAEETSNIEKEILEEVVGEYTQDLADKFQQKEVAEFLEECREFIVEHPDLFKADEGEQPQAPALPGMPAQIIGSPEDVKTQDPFRLFQVNVVHDSTIEEDSPVIVEHHPNYHNLFGMIEREMRFGGMWSTDFTMIRGGSLLRADGGYLVINAMDVLQETLAWRTLMRTLKTGKLQIQGLDTLLSIAPATLKPEPIDIDVTVILIGDSMLYHLLSYYEDDFPRTFKVRADFDRLMPRGKKQVKYYAALASKMVKEENTRHLTAKAVARLAEEGARIGGRGGKLSARLGEIADIIREANHHSDLRDHKLIDAEDIDYAIKEADYRQDLIRDRIDEAFEEDVLVIDTEGEAVGQVNGLAVHDLGTYAFGRPQRITCEVSMGDSGVVNIEREAKLSGSIHDKGVLIIEGYLRHQYGMDGPISLSASLAFEQSYAQVDGDSASLAEVLTLLSELAGVPLRQDLAVTGSVNQKGEVQAIGGINEKIEGFFRVCRDRGFTGTQGVVIPEANIPELMLSDEVLAAIGAGNFSVWTVSTVDQAIEIFTGTAAGRKLKKGGWTKGSIHDRVDLILADFYWFTKSTPERDEKGESQPGKPSRPPRPREKRDGGEPEDPRDQREAKRR